ncbi:MAG: cobalt transporter component CbiQ [Bacteroidetes bacterium]|nr:cobalt transporter component CbiQ [Bacteroidota bacterium]
MNPVNPHNHSLRAVRPETKAAFMLLSLVLSLASGQIVTQGLIICMHLLLILWANGFRRQHFFKLLLGQSLFVAVGLLPALFSLNTPQQDVLWQMGGIHVSQSSVQLLITTWFRCFTGIFILNVFAFSTPVYQTVELLRRCKVPETVVDLLILIYNNIRLLFSLSEQMLLAQKSRLAYTGNRNYRQAAQLLTGIFLVSLLKSQYLQQNVEARCYDGCFRLLEPQETAPRFANVMYVLAGLALIVITVFQLYIR